MSTIKVDTIQSRQHSTSTINLTSTGATVNGDCTATTFSGSGASLTALPAANLTGTLPALSAANLTSIPAANLTGTLPAIDGSNLTGVGGGSLEYVSTTTVSSDNSTTQIDFTSLDTNAVYKIIARKIKFSGSGVTLRIRFLDGSGNYQSNINYWREKGRSSGEEFSNQNYIMCDTDGSTQYMSFIAELHTPAIYNWLYFNGYPPQEQDNRCDIYASFSSSNTSGTINGIRFYMESGYYFQSGTEILLYKYKMS
tara:strand:+ start:1077 stop:1838 length:762 start_codon:yes stop_codon:yes gene_type:complete